MEYQYFVASTFFGHMKLGGNFDGKIDPKLNLS
jgi:hypothetical protein